MEFNELKTLLKKMETKLEEDKKTVSDLNNYVKEMERFSTDQMNRDLEVMNNRKKLQTAMQDFGSKLGTYTSLSLSCSKCKNVMKKIDILYEEFLKKVDSILEAQKCDESVSILSDERSYSGLNFGRSGDGRIEITLQEPNIDDTVREKQPILVPETECINVFSEGTNATTASDSAMAPISKKAYRTEASILPFRSPGKSNHSRYLKGEVSPSKRYVSKESKVRPLKRTCHEDSNGMDNESPSLLNNKRRRDVRKVVAVHEEEETIEILEELKIKAGNIEAGKEREYVPQRGVSRTTEKSKECLKDVTNVTDEVNSKDLSKKLEKGKSGKVKLSEKKSIGSFSFSPAKCNSKSARYRQTKLTLDGKIKKTLGANILKGATTLTRKQNDADAFVNSEGESDDDFDKIPKKGSDVKYQYREETVRKKAQRAQMPAFACIQCKEYFGSNKLTDVEKIEKINRICRHKSKNPPPSTPPGFWDLERTLEPKTLTPQVTMDDEDIFD
ncbi:uncharacterized protein LOC136026955 [Artemia franciscana]